MARRRTWGFRHGRCEFRHRSPKSSMFSCGEKGIRTLVAKPNAEERLAIVACLDAGDVLGAQALIAELAKRSA